MTTVFTKRRALETEVPAQGIGVPHVDHEWVQHTGMGHGSLLVPLKNHLQFGAQAHSGNPAGNPAFVSVVHRGKGVTLPAFMALAEAFGAHPAKSDAARKAVYSLLDQSHANSLLDQSHANPGVSFMDALSNGFSHANEAVASMNKYKPGAHQSKVGVACGALFVNKSGDALLMHVGDFPAILVRRSGAPLELTEKVYHNKTDLARSLGLSVRLKSDLRHASFRLLDGEFIVLANPGLAAALDYRRIAEIVSRFRDDRNALSVLDVHGINRIDVDADALRRIRRKRTELSSAVSKIAKAPVDSLNDGQIKSVLGGFYGANRAAHELIKEAVKKNGSGNYAAIVYQFLQ